MILFLPYLMQFSEDTVFFIRIWCNSIGIWLFDPYSFYGRYIILSIFDVSLKLLYLMKFYNIPTWSLFGLIRWRSIHLIFIWCNSLLSLRFASLSMKPLITIIYNSILISFYGDIRWWHKDWFILDLILWRLAYLISVW